MRRNINISEIETLIDSCDFKPKRYHILTTANEEENYGEFEIEASSEEMLDPWQWVIASGEGSEYKPGDKVMLDIESLSTRQPDPEDRTRIIEYLKLTAIPVGEETYTIVHDNVVLGKKAMQLEKM